MAARLVNPSFDFARAARNALALLDACKEALAERVAEKLLLAKAEAYDAETPSELLYVKLVSYVTKKRDSGDAERAFNKLARFLMLEAETYEFACEGQGTPAVVPRVFNKKFVECSKEITEEELEAWLEKVRTEPTAGFTARRLQEQFPVWEAWHKKQLAKDRGFQRAKIAAEKKRAAEAAKKALEM